MTCYSVLSLILLAGRVLRTVDYIMLIVQKRKERFRRTPDSPPPAIPKDDDPILNSDRSGVGEISIYKLILRMLIGKAVSGLWTLSFDAFLLSPLSLGGMHRSRYTDTVQALSADEYHMVILASQ